MIDNDNKRESEILDFLKERYGGRLLLSVSETGNVLGLAPQSIYNRISKAAKKPFPIKVVRMGGPKFNVHDIARYISTASTL